MTDRYSCVIEMDTTLNPDNIKHNLCNSYGVFGGMSISNDSACFQIYAPSYELAFDKLHIIARELASDNSEWIVKIWESGSK